MSLFKTKEWWNSEPDGEAEDGIFGCMALARLGPEGDTVILAMGHCLRLYRPGSPPPQDLALELQLEMTVIQVDSAKMISGVDGEQLVVLHPRRVVIFALLTRPGRADCGEQSQLEEQYNVPLPLVAHALVLAIRGGCASTPLLVVQAADATLMFFERELPLFHCRPPGALLPAPIVYDPCTDSFIVCSSDGTIECYSYRALSQSADVTLEDVEAEIDILPDWTYNIGDDIVDIQIIQTTSRQCCAVLAGERTLYALNGDGTLRFARRLDFEPACFRAYLQGWCHDAAARLLVLVASPAGTLLVLEEGRALWAARLAPGPAPRVILRGNFPGLAGALLQLISSGALRVSYLGARPELLPAPPLPSEPAGELGAAAARERTLRLEAIIDGRPDVGEIRLIDPQADKKLPFHVRVDSPVPTFSTDKINIEGSLQCPVEVILEPLEIPSYNIRATFAVQPPLEILHNRNEPLVASVIAGKGPVSSLELLIAVLFVDASGRTRVSQQKARLPLGLVYHAVRPLEEGECEIVLVSDKPAVSLLEILNDIDLESFLASGGSSTAVALEPRNGSSSTVSVLVDESSRRYRVLGTPACLAPVVCAMIERLKASGAMIRLGGQSSSPPSAPLAALLAAAEYHLLQRQELQNGEERLDVALCQFSVVQKRLVMEYRKSRGDVERSAGLLRESRADIKRVTADLQTSRLAVERSANELSCCIHLMLTLLDVMEPSSERMALAKSALSPLVINLDNQNWEDSAMLGASHLLSASQREQPLPAPALAKAVRQLLRRACRPPSPPTQKKTVAS